MGTAKQYCLLMCVVYRRLKKKGEKGCFKGPGDPPPLSSHLMLLSTASYERMALRGE